MNMLQSNETSETRSTDDSGNDTRLVQFHVPATISFQELGKRDLSSLIDHILSTHHQYAKEKAAIIYDLSRDLKGNYSVPIPELADLSAELFFFLHNLLNHMMKEEQILFPNILQLIKNKNHSLKGRYTTFGLIQEWVHKMRMYHRSSREGFARLQEITNNYSIPESAPTSLKTLYKMLQEFQADFFIHTEVEDTILFPKAIAEDES